MIQNPFRNTKFLHKSKNLYLKDLKTWNPINYDFLHVKTGSNLPIFGAELTQATSLWIFDKLVFGMCQSEDLLALRGNTQVFGGLELYVNELHGLCSPQIRNWMMIFGIRQTKYLALLQDKWNLLPAWGRWPGVLSKSCRRAVWLECVPLSKHLQDMLYLEEPESVIKLILIKCHNSESF